MLPRGLLAIVILLASALAVIHLRVEIMREGYHLGRLDARHGVLEDEGRVIQTRINRTVTSTRADEMNRTLGLGLQPPAAEEGQP